MDEEKNKIEPHPDKFLYSRFWFWKNNAADERALKVIKEGHIEKAIAIWEEVIFEGNKKKLSAQVVIDNLVTYSANWPEVANDEHVLTKNGDEYVIIREKKTGSSVPCVFAELNYQDNWTIEVETQWFAGVDKNSYGIIFGKEQNSYYSFVITGDGSFSLTKQTDGGYKELIPWKKAFAINPRSANHLLIKKVGDQVGLFVNNHHVCSIQSEPFFGKNFGFKVWGNQKVSFKNFKFCQLIETDAEINVSNGNYSCIKNLSMLYLSLATNNGTFQPDYFKKGIELSKHFFVSGQNEGYAKLIEGESYFYYPEKTLSFYIDEVVDSIKSYLDKPEGISTNELINSFLTFPVETKKILYQRFFSKQIQNIEKQIDIAKAVKNNSASHAANAGKRLVKSTREDIAYLRKSLGDNDLQYANIADMLSHEIMQCGIDYYSYLFDIDYKLANTNIASYLSEQEYALGIAVSNEAKDRLKDILNLYKKKSAETKLLTSPKSNGRLKKRI